MTVRKGSLLDGELVMRRRCGKVRRWCGDENSCHRRRSGAAADGGGVSRCAHECRRRVGGEVGAGSSTT
ncbi:hypothetical protein MTO96_018187 [Rhipicephalus appendiculatus]